MWQSIPYTLIGPDNSAADTAVINDPADSKFVGYLSEPPSGLGAAGIRERGGAFPDRDGGWHGPFLQDRMPFGLSGIILPSGVQATDEGRRNRLALATRAIRADGVIYWTEAVRGPLKVSYRTQTKTRFGGRRPKTFTCSLISSDYRVFDYTQTVASPLVNGAVPAPLDWTITNDGNAPMDWELSIYPVGGGSYVNAFRIDIFADAARTQLLSRNQFAGINTLTGDRFYVRSGNVNAPFPGDDGSLRNIAGNNAAFLASKLIYHPLNWEPAPAGLSYARLIVDDGANPWTVSFSWRSAWDY